ncbi:hypothetical protein RchiOBHm_Chr2g0172701 [Rosa chinensis]|uniref:Uncharacterized protein n=1 Tax=Rosa chinensis TaxID=74649 RepID=A0A2P6S5N7_ROSCH|nr:hypothetical protein RchiOBHm_Chr2g0172701 [Rosa chinensis]
MLIRVRKNVINATGLQLKNLIHYMLIAIMLKSPPACLVPGAGLGRLALEISCRGVHTLWLLKILFFFRERRSIFIEEKKNYKL